MELYGQTIGKVRHIKDGKGSNDAGDTWTWRMWSFYIGDDSFTYFTSGKKPEPFEGMKIAYLKYKEEPNEKDGKTYTNRTVDKLEVSEESPAPSQVSTQPKAAQPQKEPKVDWDAIAYKKCKYGFLKEVFAPLIKGELPNETLGTLEGYAEEFATMCMRISLDYTTATQEPKQEKPIANLAPEPNVGTNEPPGDDIPPISAYEDDK